MLRAIPAIHEINVLREVFEQRVGKFLLKSIIDLWNDVPRELRQNFLKMLHERLQISVH